MIEMMMFCLPIVITDSTALNEVEVSHEMKINIKYNDCFLAVSAAGVQTCCAVTSKLYNSEEEKSWRRKLKV